MRSLPKRGNRRVTPDENTLIDAEISVQDAKRELDRAVDALRQRVRERDDLTRRHTQAG